MSRHSSYVLVSNGMVLPQVIVETNICDSAWGKGPCAFFQNQVIATAVLHICLVMKANCCGVIAISVHSCLSNAKG